MHHAGPASSAVLVTHAGQTGGVDRSRSALLLGTAVVVASLAGCSGGSTPRGTGGSTPPAPSPASTTPAVTASDSTGGGSTPSDSSTPTPTGSGASAQTPTPAASSAGPALASAAGASPDTRGVTIAVASLRRDSPTTVTMTATVTSTRPDPFTLDHLSAPPSEGRYEYPSASGVTLIDPVGRLRYYPVHDTARHCVCSVFLIGDGLKVGESALVSVTFPAPPAGVTTMTVAWADFVPAAGVPLS